MGKITKKWCYFMFVQDWLIHQTKSLFVGRKDLMSAIRSHAASTEWKLLHLYGPGGIGKTTLLQRMTGVWPDENVLHVEDSTQLTGKLSSLSGIRKMPAGEETRVRRIADTLHARADRNGGSLLLLIDGFEPWSHAALWFKEHLLPRLRLDKIRIVTAGRNPLLGSWQQNGWQLLVTNQAVHPLDAADI